MKSVMISIQPKWCELIASGCKTMELRKSVPKLERPFKVYIYCTRPKFRRGERARLSAKNRYYIDLWAGKVIGEFVCDGILYDCEMANADIAENRSIVRREKIFEYSGGKEVYGWNISDLVIYEEPRPLTDFAVMECLWHNIRNHGCIDASGERCLDCRLKRPPQSWCYVEG